MVSYIKKTVTISTDDTTKKESVSTQSKEITNSTQDILKVFGDTKLVYPKDSNPLAQGTEDLFRYYALESSGDEKTPNPIDKLLTINPRNETIDKAIVEMKKELSWIQTKDKKSIMNVFTKWKKAIEFTIQSLSKAQQKPIQDALNAWADKVWISTNPTEKPKITTA